MDALYVVLKFLSSTPYCEDWLTTVSAEDVHTVLTLGGVLSTASREMFKSLDSDNISILNKHDFRALASVMAPHIECLHLHDPEYRRFDFERLSRLRVLKVNHNVNANLLEQVLIAVGEKLVELQIHTTCVKKRSIRDIARYCKSLKVFNSGYADYRVSSKPIWTALGGTLIELQGCFPQSDLVHIAHYCTRLEKVNLLDCTFYNEGLVIDLLRALKTLRVLVIDFFDFGEPDYYPVNNVRMLVDACSPNIKIHSYCDCENNSSFVDFVRIVGTRLSRLNVICQSVALPRDVLPALRNVEELSFDLLKMNPQVGYMSMLESVFVDPLPNLRKLTLRCVNTSRIFSVIARSASNIREFECGFQSILGVDDGQVHVNGADVTEFLQANEHLRSIVLCYRGTEVSVIDGIIGLIPRLKVRRHLRVAAFQFWPRYRSANIDGKLLALYSDAMSEKIRDACVSLRTKPLSLTVNLVSYLPA